MADNFESYMHDTFAEIGSRNKLSVAVGHSADWWLANFK